MGASFHNLTTALLPTITQRCENVVVRSQRRTTNTQRCSDVDATMSK